MKKAIALLLALGMAGLMAGCAATAEQHSGEAQGYGGPVRVTVSISGTDITAVQVTSHNETPGVGSRAIEALPEMIVQADSIDVDGVSGATITSNAIKAAVAMAIGATSSPEPTQGQVTLPVQSAAMSGVGMAATGRLGPGTAEDGSPVYSFNVVFASADFDAEGRILALDVDQLEVLSSQFTGFPEEKEGETDFLNQVSQWTTKGAQGERYMMESGSWRQQMDAYQQMMIGKTVDEINAWYEANFSQETGRPNENADVISGASMSLRGENGDILTAIQRAWEDAQRGQGGESSTATDLPVPTEDGMMNDTNTQNDGTEDATFG
nr:FMN-binding protein [Clostridia bacterium]